MAHLGASQRVGDVEKHMGCGRFAKTVRGVGTGRRGCRGDGVRAAGRRDGDAPGWFSSGEMAADLGRGQPEAAEGDLVPGLEAAGVPVQVEDRRLDRVRVLASPRRAARCRPSSPRSSAGCRRFRTSCSAWWRWPARASGTVPSVSPGRRRGRGRPRCRPGCPRPSGRGARRPAAGPPRCSGGVAARRGGAVRGELRVARCPRTAAPRRRPARPSSRTCTFFMLLADSAWVVARVVVAAHPDVGGAEVA